MGQKRRSVVDILNLLPKDNCGECGAPTCMAFAVKVLGGSCALQQCPYLLEGDQGPPDVASTKEQAPTEPDDREEALSGLMAQVSALDFPATAARLGLELRGDRIAVTVLGRLFEVGPSGSLHSDCHINTWVHGPILQYLIGSAGRALSGQWVTYADLRGAADWSQFYNWRCGRGFEQLALEDPDLFFDVLTIFGSTPEPGSMDEELLSADRVVRLEPLPGVVMLFRYWRPDGDFEAKLSVLFDSASGQNVDAGSIYTLAQGLVEMFKRIVLRHGGGTGDTSAAG